MLMIHKSVVSVVILNTSDDFKISYERKCLFSLAKIVIWYLAYLCIIFSRIIYIIILRTSNFVQAENF